METLYSSFALFQDCANIIVSFCDCSSNLCSLAEKSGFFDQVFSLQDYRPADVECVLSLSSICSFLGSESCSPKASSSSPYLSINNPLGPVFESFLTPGCKKPLVALNWSGNQEAESPSHTVRARAVPIQILETIPALVWLNLFLFNLAGRMSYEILLK